jgi:hypothetical protein
MPGQTAVQNFVATVSNSGKKKGGKPMSTLQSPDEFQQETWAPPSSMDVRIRSMPPHEPTLSAEQRLPVPTTNMVVTPDIKRSPHLLEKNDTASGSTLIAAKIVGDHSEMRTFLREAGLAEFADAFLEEGYDTVEMLLKVTDKELQEVGLRTGHIKKFLKQKQAAAKIAADKAWTNLGPGCCSEYGSASMELLYNDWLGGLDDCKNKCLAFVTCGFIQWGWYDNASTWCTVIPSTQLCGSLHTGTSGCGTAGNNGVQTYQYQANTITTEANTITTEAVILKGAADDKHELIEMVNMPVLHKPMRSDERVAVNMTSDEPVAVSMTSDVPTDGHVLRSD